jgi:hypothetical protein
MDKVRVIAALLACVENAGPLTLDGLGDDNVV